MLTDKYCFSFCQEWFFMYLEAIITEPQDRAVCWEQVSVECSVTHGTSTCKTQRPLEKMKQDGCKRDGGGGMLWDATPRHSIAVALETSEAVATHT